jgi:hypothetical protein
MFYGETQCQRTFLKSAPLFSPDLRLNRSPSPSDTDLQLDHSVSRSPPCSTDQTDRSFTFSPHHHPQFSTHVRRLLISEETPILARASTSRNNARPRPLAPSKPRICLRLEFCLRLQQPFLPIPTCLRSAGMLLESSRAQKRNPEG